MVFPRRRVPEVAWHAVTAVAPFPSRARDLNSHIPALDGLRGLAILAVMLYHFSGDFDFGPSRIGMWALRALRAGWVGVDLFFVLSGFLITGILIDTVSSHHYFRNFYARRILRIFPLYYTALLIVLCVVPFLPRAEELRHHQPWLWLYGTNILIAFKGFSSVTSPWLQLGHFWSLAVEEHFYLVWPVIVLMLRRSRLLPVACLVLAAASFTARFASARYSPMGYVLTQLRLDPLLIGALLADLTRRPRADALTRKIAPWLAIVAAGGLGILFLRFKGFDPYQPEVQRYVFVLLDVVFAWMTLYASVQVTGLLTARPLRWLGKYSYGLYVWHGLFHRPLANLLPTAGLVTRLHVPYAVACLTRIAAFSSVALTAAWSSYHGIEKHFLNLKRLFPYETEPEQTVSRSRSTVSEPDLPLESSQPAAPLR
jgi:peptidoglycan/LPS O-acetylase OafA/YrhL